MNLKMRMTSALMALIVLTTPGFGAPTILHDPIKAAEKAKPLGVRATVRDAAARVESVSLFYASSRGMTPFRADMTGSGAGVWLATIPGHLMGPGDQMFYYIQAENADGETRETEWHTIKLVESGMAPAAIPSATEVARQAQREATPRPAPVPAPAPPPRTSRSKYLVPAAVIVGGAVAVGGALAIANHDSGGGGGGGDGGTGTVTNGNFGGTYDICFTPSAGTNSSTVCDNGLVNIYVSNGALEIVGLWDAEVLTASLSGNSFTAVKAVAATVQFPAAQLIVSGEFNGPSCTARVDGYSTDPLAPGNFSGRLNTTRR